MPRIQALVTTDNITDSTHIADLGVITCRIPNEKLVLDVGLHPMDGTTCCHLIKSHVANMEVLQK